MNLKPQACSTESHKEQKEISFLLSALGRFAQGSPWSSRTPSGSRWPWVLDTALGWCSSHPLLWDSNPHLQGSQQLSFLVFDFAGSTVSKRTEKTFLFPEIICSALACYWYTNNVFLVVHLQHAAWVYGSGWAEAAAEGQVHLGPWQGALLVWGWIFWGRILTPEWQVTQYFVLPYFDQEKVTCSDKSPQSEESQSLTGEDKWVLCKVPAAVYVNPLVCMLGSCVLVGYLQQTSVPWSQLLIAP